MSPGEAKTFPLRFPDNYTVRTLPEKKLRLK